MTNRHFQKQKKSSEENDMVLHSCKPLSYLIQQKTTGFLCLLLRSICHNMLICTLQTNPSITKKSIWERDDLVETRTISGPVKISQVLFILRVAGLQSLTWFSPYLCVPFCPQSSLLLTWEVFWSPNFANKLLPQHLCSCYSLCFRFLFLDLCLSLSFTSLRCQIKFLFHRPPSSKKRAPSSSPHPIILCYFPYSCFVL